MAQVTLYLPVVKKPPHVMFDPDRAVIWTRTLTTDFLPLAGDMVALWDDEDAQWPVRSRWWDADGTVAVEFVPMQLDPDRTLPSSATTSRAWYAVRDGAPDPHLERAGWTKK